MSSEKKKLFDFLQEAINASSPDDPIHEAKLRFTHFEFTDEDDYGLILSNVVSQPGASGAGYVEYDARLIVTGFARIGGVERDDRHEPYELSKAIALRAAQLIGDDDSLGGRTCRAVTGQMVDDVDDQLSVGQRHAVNNLYVVCNWSGAELPAPWGSI